MKKKRLNSSPSETASARFFTTEMSKHRTHHHHPQLAAGEIEAASGILKNNKKYQWIQDYRPLSQFMDYIIRIIMISFESFQRGTEVNRNKIVPSMENQTLPTVEM